MARDFFSAEEKKWIREAILEAEKGTSGEIQVHLENHAMKPLAERVQEVFNILEISETSRRNGVLFYLAIKDRQFAILGDAGIDQVVEPGFWDAIRQHMEVMFREGKFTDGICDGIRMAGEQLAKYFPITKDDRNELPDDIS
ncbi:MAG TPA: TPM domain-containing protein, partial [Cyclobacteriaceae bacterium]|nr:TPM domain-containing protein [Cyclobacteriaceae bacterium]